MARSERGTTLIEVMVAIVIFSMGILGLLGVQARAFTTFTDSQNRMQAALLADRLLNQAWVDRANLGAYAYGGGAAPAVLRSWLAAVGQQLPSGAAVVTVAGGTVQVTLTWQPPTRNITHQYVAQATVQDP